MIRPDLIASAIVDSPLVASPAVDPSPDSPAPPVPADATARERIARESTPPDLSTVRDEVRRRFAGARHRLLLTRRAELADESESTDEPKLADEHDPFRVAAQPIRSRTTGHADLDRPTSSQGGGRFSLVVAPRLPNGDLVFAVRHSHAARRWGLELPRLDDQDEDEGWLFPAHQCLTECGVLASGGLSILGAVNLDSRQLSGSLLVVFAGDCQLATVREDMGPESLAGVVVAAPRVVAELARKGAIECARTLAALQLLRSRVAEL